MIINLKFFAILAFSILIYWLLPKQPWRNVFLILSSLLFIGLFDPHVVIMIVFLSVFTYACAVAIEKGFHKRFYHRLGIIGLLLTLVFFKYLGFLVNTLSNLTNFLAELPSFNIEKLFLPLGISYIVFKYISYLTDIHWGIIKKGSFFDFLLYGSLFTIYVAGPIERFERFKSQVESRQIFRVSFIEDGFQRIVYGLFKKLVIADWLGYFIAPVWAEPAIHSLGIKALALLGYSIQIYMDFSGYSDIAIGSSRLFGLKIMEYFNWPYFQPNISKFWRNWHISLSDWIRDYLFFPLSRFSENRLWLTVAVPLIAMGLCGLWHGSEWHFVLWGLWHGLGLVILQAWHRHKKALKLKPAAVFKNHSVFSSIFTFSFVTVGWLFFK